MAFFKWRFESFFISGKFSWIVKCFSVHLSFFIFLVSFSFLELKLYAYWNVFLPIFSFSQVLLKLLFLILFVLFYIFLFIAYFAPWIFRGSIFSCVPFVYLFSNSFWVLTNFKSYSPRFTIYLSSHFWLVTFFQNYFFISFSSFSNITFFLVCSYCLLRYFEVYFSVFFGNDFARNYRIYSFSPSSCLSEMGFLGLWGEDFWGGGRNCPK